MALPVKKRERDMRAKASWDPVIEGTYMPSFGNHCVRAFDVADLALLGDVWVEVSFDHGHAAGKQTAAITFHVDRRTDRPKSWTAAEVCRPDEVLSLEAFAELVCAAMVEIGIDPTHVDAYVGDRSTAGNHRQRVRSNARLRRALIAAAQRVPAWSHLSLSATDFGEFATPQKGAGSVFDGLNKMNGMAQHDELIVHPRCTHTIHACRTFAGDGRDPVKDILDAVRYGHEDAWRRTVYGAVRGRY